MAPSAPPSPSCLEISRDAGDAPRRARLEVLLVFLGRPFLLAEEISTCHKEPGTPESAAAIYPICSQNLRFMIQSNMNSLFLHGLHICSNADKGAIKVRRSEAIP